jgi:hypothetical protein
VHLQPTGAFHQDFFVAGKVIAMAADSKGCAAIADCFGGVLLWRVSLPMPVNNKLLNLAP